LPDSLVINVRQIAQYAARSPVDGSDLVLVQTGGLGGPYYSATATALFTTVGLNPAGPFVWGVTAPADAVANQIMTDSISMLAQNSLLFNAYIDGGYTYWKAGIAGALGMAADNGQLNWAVAASGAADTPITLWQYPMVVLPSGHMTLLDTLTVARDPTAALEVATLGYLTAHTVASFNTRIGAVTLTTADITGAGGAPIVSPAFAGIPSGPTAAPGSATPQLATTQFVTSAIAAVSPDVHTFNGRSGDVTFLTADFNAATAVAGPATAPTPLLTDSSTTLATTAFVTTWAAANAVTSFNTRHGAITLTAADITAAGGALLASPAFSGTPNGPTANPGTSTGQLATTAFVQAAIVAATAGVSSWNGRTGAVVLSQSDIVNAAGWASPSFTGIPLAPTAATPTNNTQIATTAFVHAAIGAGAPGVASFNTRTGAVVLTAADVSSVNGALLAGPAFTGTPTANTAAPGTNTTQLATTAFVAAALAAISTGVTSFNGRTGPVVLQGNDVSAAGGALIAGPTFTGVPKAPTATTGDSSFQLATTQFVTEAIAAGVSGVSTWNGRAGAVVMTIADITGTGGAPVASPAFTGVPIAPTATAGTNTTQIATTAFVAAALAALPVNVASFNTRTGAVTLTAADITAVGGAVGSFLPLAGGTLTGNVTVSPPAAGPANSGLMLNSTLPGPALAELVFQTNGLKRWILANNAGGETGGNVGSDFYLQNYDDTGAFLSNVLVIKRSSGAVQLSTANPRLDFVTGGGANSWITDNGASFNFLSNAGGSQGLYILRNTSAWTAISDARLPYKKTARPLTVLDRLEHVQLYENEVDGRLELFAKAQEVHQDFPHVVKQGSGDDDYVPTGMSDAKAWGLSYDRLGIIALQAAKELLAELKELRARVRNLEQRTTA
jgi:hypothetical protein